MAVAAFFKKHSFATGSTVLSTLGTVGLTYVAWQANPPLTWGAAGMMTGICAAAVATGLVIRN